MPIPPTIRHNLLHTIGVLITIIIPKLIQVICALYVKQPYHTSILSGEGWVQELLNGHPKRIQCELGVSKEVFNLLIHELQSMGHTRTRHVSLEEQLAIFLYTSVTGLSVRHTGERFQRANATISKWVVHLLHIKATYLYYLRYFKRMVEVFSSRPFYTKYIRQPTSYNQSSHPLYYNKKLWPFFQHALGAIDGSHIHFSPPVFYQAAYRNRKGFLSQNCLFACSFDLKFTYALTGWEGSAADARVYHSAVNTDLVIPDGWYYLGDAGFPHCNNLLVPFRGVRYHLAEWGRSTIRYILFTLF